MKKLIGSIISILLAAVLAYGGMHFLDTNRIICLVCFIGFLVCILIATILLMLYRNKLADAKLNEYKNRLKMWSNISYHISQVSDDVISDLPIGILIYDESYDIKWANDFCKKSFQADLVDSNLSIISSKLADSVSRGETLLLMDHNDLQYDVINNVKNNAIYFFEVTKREEIIKQYNKRIAVVGILGIDNLDESLKKYDLQAKTSIRGEILGEISDWINNYGCYGQNLSNDKMIIFLDREALNQMIKDKFSILNKVREINTKNRLRSSLSIGLASYDIPSSELGPLAQQAFELAEKRGGDQVVVNIQGQKVQYFGGNTNSLEKNTLLDARMQSTALKDAVSGSTNVLVMCHNLADCDAIGSMFGVFYLIQGLGKEVKMAFDPEYADKTVKKIYSGLIKNHPEIAVNIVKEKEALELLKPTSLLVITDTQSPKLVMFQSLFKQAKRLSVIDHHRAGDDGYKDTLSYYVESSASSAVELVSEMFMFLSSDEKSIPDYIASIMLAGMIVDTNNFTFRSGSRTFEAAATLRGLGADMVYVRKLLRESIDDEKDLSEALINTEIINKHFAVSKLSENKICSDRTFLAKVSDRLLTIDNVDTSFTIGYVSDGVVGISARSLDTVNVQVIMEEMGGGGHFNGAATQIKDCTIEKAYKQLLDILEQEYGEEGGEKMKVILTSDVKNKGKKGEILEVANGYGNYLLTNKLALAATNENIAKIEEEKKQALIDEENRRNVLKKLRDEVQDKFISVRIKVGADGKTFGHITTKQICDEFEAQTGIHLDKRKVEVPQDINTVGIFTATIKFEHDIIATFEVNVIDK